MHCKYSFLLNAFLFCSVIYLCIVEFVLIQLLPVVNFSTQQISAVILYKPPVHTLNLIWARNEIAAVKS